MADKIVYPISSDVVDEKSTSSSMNLSSSNVVNRDEIKKLRKNRLLAYSTVGTPDYIAPEVFG